MTAGIPKTEPRTVLWIGTHRQMWWGRKVAEQAQGAYFIDATVNDQPGTALLQGPAVECDWNDDREPGRRLTVNPRLNQVMSNGVPTQRFGRVA